MGSGLTAANSITLRRALDAGEAVVIEVEHRGRTPSGGLRHPVFLRRVKGWRPLWPRCPKARD